jgi:hypothetical protein
MSKNITGTITIIKANPKITWTPPTIIYGRAITSSDLNATATDIKGNSLRGTFTYATPKITINVGDMLDADSYSITVTFTSGDSNYNNGTTTGTLVISQSPITLKFTSPTTTYGIPFDNTILNAIATDNYGNTILGTYSYTVTGTKTIYNVGDTPDAGIYNMTISFIPTHKKNYTS